MDIPYGEKSRCATQIKLSKAIRKSINYVSVRIKANNEVTPRYLWLVALVKLNVLPDLEQLFSVGPDAFINYRSTNTPLPPDCPFTQSQIDQAREAMTAELAELEAKMTKIFKPHKSRQTDIIPESHGQATSTPIPQPYYPSHPSPASNPPSPSSHFSPGVYDRVMEELETPTFSTPYKPFTPPPTPMELAKADGWLLHPDNKAYLYRGTEVEEGKKVLARYSNPSTPPPPPPSVPINDHTPINNLETNNENESD